MNTINFTWVNKEWILIIQFDWEFTNENASKIFDEIKEYIRIEWKFKVIFDLAKIETINSRAAWWFARIFEYLDEFWWDLYVTNMNVFIEDTFDLLWMFLFIKKSKTTDSAIVDLNS